MAESPARQLIELGRSWEKRGHVDEAAALFEASLLSARHVEDTTAEVEALTRLGHALSLACAPRRSEQAFSEAGALLTARGDRDGARRATARAAFMAYDAGDLDRALAMLEDISSSLSTEREPDRVLAALAVGYRANVARSTGALADACAGYERAIDRLEREGDAKYAGVFRMDRAAVSLLEGRPADALLWLDRARRYVDRAPPDSMLSALIAHYTLMSAIVLEDRALVRRYGSALDLPRAPATEFLERVHEAALGSDPARALDELDAVCPPFEHGRLAFQILKRALRVPSPLARQLTFDAAARTVRVGETSIDLSSRAPLFRIVDALTRQAVDRPGEGLDAAALVRAGWPDERILPAAAKNRLHVALATLRRLGLRGSIVRAGSGYLLTPRLSVVRAE